MADKQIKDLNALVSLAVNDKLAVQASPSDVTGYGTVQQILDLVPAPPTPFDTYTKTVRVSKSAFSEDAPRTGFTLFSEKPFNTIQAACNAIVAASESNVAIICADEYYDEIVTLPAGVDLVGTSQRTFITKVICNSGGQNRLKDLWLYNDLGFSVVAPNLGCLEISGGTTVYTFNVELYYVKNSLTLGLTRAACVINGGSLTMRESEFALDAIHGGASTEIYAGILLIGALSTVTMTQSDAYAISNALNQSVCGIAYEATDANARADIRHGCALSGIIAGVAGVNARAAGIIASGGAVGRIRATGVFMAPRFTGGGTGILASVLASSSSGVNALDVVLANPVLAFDQDPSAGSSEGALVSVRIIEAVYARYPLGSTEPARVGALTGIFVHTGSLRSGLKFPATTYKIQALAGRNQTDGSIGGPVGTEEGQSILPSNWGSGVTFKFAAQLWTNNAAKTMTARLINALTLQVVAVVSTNATVPTKVISAPLTVGVGATDLQTADTPYLIQIELTSGTVADLGKMSGAWLEIA